MHFFCSWPTRAISIFVHHNRTKFGVTLGIGNWEGKETEARERIQREGKANQQLIGQRPIQPFQKWAAHKNCSL